MGTSNSAPNYVTVVYAVNDPIAFEAERKRIMGLYSNNQAPWSITAITYDNEIQRLELISTALQQNRAYLVPYILDATIGNLVNLLDLEKDLRRRPPTLSDKMTFSSPLGEANPLKSRPK